MNEKKLQILLNNISVIREEPDVQKRMEMMLTFNNSLPMSLRLDPPSLITNAYVRKALDMIEEKVSLSLMQGSPLTSRTA